MKLRAYLFLFVFPYALLVGAIAIAFGWTNAQEQRLRGHDAIVDQAVVDAREQCTFDQELARADVPSFCERLP